MPSERWHPYARLGVASRTISCRSSRARARQHSSAPLCGYGVDERIHPGHHPITRKGGPRVGQAGRDLGFQPSRIAGFLLCSLEFRGQGRENGVHARSLVQCGNFHHLPRRSVQRRSSASSPIANRMVETMVDKNKKAPRKALVCLLTGGEGGIRTRGGD